MAMDPMHQFEIHELVSFELFDHTVMLTNQSAWMIGAVVFIAALFMAGARKRAMVPGRLQGMVEVTFEFIQNLVKDTAGEQALRYLPVVFTLFLFVTVLNVSGMIPGSFTSTSQLAITGAMAFCVFASVIVIGLLKHGPKFFTLFVPHGIPVWMIPVMIPLELISFFARPFTLAIRLGANMMAGHLVLKLFASFVIMLLSQSLLGDAIAPYWWLFVVVAGVGGFAVAAPEKFKAFFAKGTPVKVGVVLAGLAALVVWPFVLPLFGLFALTGLELIVAFLQAYIFTLLSVVYLNDALHLH